MSGSINFLVTGTRPDLAFPISMLSSYNADPSQQHINGMKQVLRYLRRTVERALTYPRLHDDGTTPTNKSALSVRLEVYAGASYNSNPDTAKPIGAYAVQLDGGTIAWSAKTQSTVACSTCEAKYIAYSDAASQLLWTRQILTDLNISVC
ncbi:hypothetical protein V8C34DRAFT_271066 [Trichoderma compactum]